MAVAAGERVLRDLYLAGADDPLTPEQVHLHLQESGVEALIEASLEHLPESSSRPAAVWCGPADPISRPICTPS